MLVPRKMNKRGNFFENALIYINNKNSIIQQCNFISTIKYLKQLFWKLIRKKPYYCNLNLHNYLLLFLSGKSIHKDTTIHFKSYKKQLNAKITIPLPLILTVINMIFNGTVRVTILPQNEFFLFPCRLNSFPG